MKSLWPTYSSNSLTHFERSQLIALSDHQTPGLILHIFQYREDPRIGQRKSTEKKYNQTCFVPSLTLPALTSYNAQEGSASDSSLWFPKYQESTPIFHLLPCCAICGSVSKFLRKVFIKLRFCLTNKWPFSKSHTSCKF